MKTLLVLFVSLVAFYMLATALWLLGESVVRVVGM